MNITECGCLRYMYIYLLNANTLPIGIDKLHLFPFVLFIHQTSSGHSNYILIYADVPADNTNANFLSTNINDVMPVGGQVVCSSCTNFSTVPFVRAVPIPKCLRDVRLELEFEYGL